MIHRLIISLGLILTVTIPAHGQQWIMNYINENGFNSDKIVNYVGTEMQKNVDKRVDSFSFNTLGKEKSVGIHEFVDRPTVLMFWKTTCSGSQMQLEELEKLRERYSENKLKILYVSPQSDSTLTAFRNKHDVSSTIANVNKDDLEKPYQTFVTPSLFLIDSSGTIQKTWLRPKKLNELENLVTPTIK